jgi:hypothetical protein
MFISEEFGQLQAGSVVIFVLSGAAVLACIPVFRYMQRDRFFVDLRAKEAQRAMAGDLEIAQSSRSVWETVKEVLPMCSMIWVNFVLLFVVFPDSIGIWAFRNKNALLNLDDETMMQIFFFVFNVFDFLGRSLVSWGVTLKPRGVMGVTASRVVLLALFYLVTYKSDVEWLKNAVTRIVVLAVFVVTQGLAVTWSFILAPRNLKTTAENQIAGNLSSFGLVNGILVGAIIANFTGLNGAIASLISPAVVAKAV